MKRLIRMIILSFFTLAVLIVSSYAWFTNSQFVEPNISGYSVAAYFGGGDGSTSSPFKIKNQRHLYNLAWLQYLGYFNKKGSGIVEDSTANTLTHYSFSIENDINMDGWHLPPIGTSYNPFIGSLNGNGHTISNLETTNDFGDLDKHPGVVTEDNFGNIDTEQFQNSNSCSVIGFIGSIGQTTNMNYAGLGITDPTFTNLILNKTTVSTSTDETLVGSVAGYVNGTIADVGVRIPTLNVNTNAAVASLSSKTSNLSDFAVVGYAEDTYTTALTKRTTTIYNPTTSYSHFSYNGMGNTTEWGGSIDMLSLYRRINAQTNTSDSNSRVTRYISGEIIYYDENGNELVANKKTQYTNNPTTTDDDVEIGYYYKSYGASGAYLTADTAPTSAVASGYDYLGGLYKDVVSIRITGTDDGNKIKSPSNVYLNLTSTRVNQTIQFTSSISGNDDADEATIWKESSLGNGFSLSTYNKDDGQLYYLGTTNFTDLTLSTTNQFIWNYDSNYGYYFQNNNVTYYLRYIDDTWCVSSKHSYYITDNDNNYMKRNNNTIANTTDFTEATRWIFENDSTQSGIIYDESDTSFKLYISGNNLRAGNTNTNWSYSNYSIYSGSNYIVYDGTWKLYQPTDYYIRYNSNYLSLSNSGNIVNVTDDDVSSWEFSDAANLRGYISTAINNTPYYLSFDNSATNKLTAVTNQSQALQWSNDGDGPYCTYNNIKYYLQYKNGNWQATQAATKVSGFYVSYGNHYLSYDAVEEEIFDSTNISNASIWNYDSNNYIYTTVNDVKYYIYSPNNRGRQGISVSEGQPSSTRPYYLYNNNRIVFNGRNGNKYYLCYTTESSWNQYENGWNSYDKTSDFQLTLTNATIDDISSTPIPEIEANTDSISNTARSTIAKPNSTKYLIDDGFIILDRTSKEVPSMFNYIPLNTDNNNNVKETNTGYIISGGHSGVDGGLNAVDIRVAGSASAYSITSRLTSSVNSNGTILVSNNKDQVYTCDTTQEHVIDSSKYIKYNSSKQSMVETFQTAVSTNNSRVGGIHFIASEISKNRLVTAPNVIINGQPYTDYEMPENSIDFTLQTRGFINFFAALFYGGNTAFFSLHEIKRNEDGKKIDEINHIKEIYENTNDKSLPYVYKYKIADKNGYIYSNNSNTLSSEYTKIFDTDWIESPKLGAWDSGSGSRAYMKKLYYYEIPVNKGEYALGSVENKAGGYLLYLDIGANAAAVDRTTITQESKTVVSDYKYVNGIQILADTGNITSISAANSAVAVIKTTSNVSEVSISRTGDTISFGTLNNNVLTPFDNNLDVSYKSQDISLSGAELKALDEDENTKKVLKYLDYNRATESLYQTIINNDGTTNTDYEVYRLNPTTMEKTGDILDYNGMNIDDRMNATYGLLMIDTTSSSVPAGKRVDDFTSVAITTSTNPAVLKYDLYTDTTNKNNVVETIDMVVTRVTGNQTVYNLDNNINDITVTNGRLTLSDNYLAEFLYRLQGNTITITSVEETTVTVKEINRANNTYTFIFKTYDGTTYEVTAVGNTVTIPVSQ